MSDCSTHAFDIPQQLKAEDLYICPKAQYRAYTNHKYCTALGSRGARCDGKSRDCRIRERAYKRRARWFRMRGLDPKYTVGDHETSLLQENFQKIANVMSDLGIRWADSQAESLEK